MGDCGSDEILSPPGGRDGTRPVVRPGARTDDRAVADAAVALVGHAARGGAGGEVSFPVEGHTSHGAEFLSGGVPIERLEIPVVCFFGVEPTSLGWFGSHGGGEFLGSMTAEEDVLGLLHDLAGDLDGVTEALKTGDGSAVAVGSVHDARVQFVHSRGRVDGAPAGIEEAVVFHHRNGGHDGVDRAAARFEDSAARAQGQGQGSAIGRLLVRTQTLGVEMPGASMDGQGPFRCGAARLLGGRRRFGGRSACDEEKRESEGAGPAHGVKVPNRIVPCSWPIFPS